MFIPVLGVRHSKPIGVHTNNEAEALAVLEALRIIDKRYEEHIGPFGPITICTDSELIYNHLLENWKVNKVELKYIYNRIKAHPLWKNVELINLYKSMSKEMEEADRLAKDASKRPEVELTDHVTPMAYEGVEGDTKFIVEDNPPSKVVLTGVQKPFYRLHHDVVLRMVTVHEYPTDEDGSPREGVAPDPIATVTERQVIELIMKSRR